MPTKTMESTPQEALDLAQAALARLETEQALIPAQLAAAAENADAAALLRIRRRGDELPTELFAAKAAVLKARVNVLESQAPAVMEEVQRLSGELAAAAEWRRQAQEAEAQAQGRYTAANGARHDLHWDLGAAKRELSAHLAEGSRDKGPIMRASWMARGS